LEYLSICYMKFLKDTMINVLRRFIFARYIISGGTAAFINIVSALILYHGFGIYYVVSSVFGFLLGFAASFLLQKYWTFRSKNNTTLKEVSLYGFITLANLVINVALVSFFVEYIHMPYSISLILTTVLVAIWSFFIYKQVIFK
jgi:putative flippase GtrA